MQENDTCGRNATFGYAIDIAQTKHNIGIVNSLENARLTILESDDIDPSCITILDWMICYFRFPPCLGTRLLLPCGNGCGEVIRFFEVCFDTINETITDPNVREHFNGYGCRLSESYYDGYDRRHFIISDSPVECVDVPTG